MIHPRNAGHRHTRPADRQSPPRLQARHRIVVRSTRSTRPLFRNPVMPMHRRRLRRRKLEVDRPPIHRRMQHKRRGPGERPPLNPNIKIAGRRKPRAKRLTSKPLVMHKRLPRLISKRKVSRKQLIPTPSTLPPTRPRIARPQPQPKERQLISKPPPIPRPNMTGKIPPFRSEASMSRMIPRKAKMPRCVSTEKMVRQLRAEQHVPWMGGAAAFAARGTLRACEARMARASPQVARARTGSARRACPARQTQPRHPSHHPPIIPTAQPQKYESEPPPPPDKPQPQAQQSPQAQRPQRGSHRACAAR